MRLLCPKEIQPTVLDIDLVRLQEQGIRGLLIDIDNTLVAWDSAQPTQEFMDWIQAAKDRGFRICLVSNALPKRVADFAHIIDVPAIPRAVKPRRKPFVKGLRLLDLPPAEVGMIGDQLFTDVLGGNRLGLYTILIDPLSEKELSSTRLMRKIEQRILRRLARKGLIGQDAIIRRHGGKHE